MLRATQVRLPNTRANPISNYDTAALRVETDTGANVLFYTSHAVPSTIGPVARYDFEQGRAFCDTQAGGAFTARMADGVVVLHAFQKKTQTTPRRNQRCGSLSAGLNGAPSMVHQELDAWSL